MPQIINNVQRQHFNNLIIYKNTSSYFVKQGGKLLTKKRISKAIDFIKSVGAESVASYLNRLNKLYCCNQ